MYTGQHARPCPTPSSESRSTSTFSLRSKHSSTTLVNLCPVSLPILVSDCWQGFCRLVQRCRVSAFCAFATTCTPFCGYVPIRATRALVSDGVQVAKNRPNPRRLVGRPTILTPPFQNIVGPGKHCLARLCSIG